MSSARSPWFTAPGPRALVLLSGLALTGSARADHGPGTAGSGAAVQSAETLRRGKASFGLEWDYTLFESLNSAQIERRAEDIGDDHAHFDALRWSSLLTLRLAYGVLDDLELSLSVGWYRGDDLREGHIESTGEPELHDHGDVSGVTDLWIKGKYRFLKGPLGRLAAIAGIKLPTGRDDVRGDDGELLEPSVQPGSGTFDFLLGAAYSFWITERITLDASAQWTFRTEDDGFQIGDRFDGGAAAAYRLLGDAGSFPQVSIFGEVGVRHLLKNEEDGRLVKNSGGTVIFLTPGARVGFTENLAMSVAPQIPVYQDLHSEQQETLIRILTALEVTF